MKLPKIDQGKAVEEAARFQDIRERAARVRPVTVATDILDLAQFPRIGRPGLESL